MSARHGDPAALVWSMATMGGRDFSEAQFLADPCSPPLEL
jgi:hypothetical protein